VYSHFPKLPLLSPETTSRQVDVSNLFADGADPFNSRELITSKYSASVEISTNNCITFSYLNGSKECPSCDAMVFVCPHTHFEQHSVSCFVTLLYWGAERIGQLLVESPLGFESV
jgi:hypothetical protein